MPRNKKTPAQFREFLNHPEIVNFQTARFNRMVPMGTGRYEVTIPAQGANNDPDRIIICDQQAAPFFNKYHFSYTPGTNQVIAYLQDVRVDNKPVTLSLRNLMNPSFYGRHMIFRDGDVSNWTYGNIIYEEPTLVRRRITSNFAPMQQSTFRRIATQNPTPEGIREMQECHQVNGAVVETTATEFAAVRRYLMDVFDDRQLRISLDLDTLTLRLATFLRARGLTRRNHSELLRWLLEVGMDSIEAAERHPRT